MIPLADGKVYWQGLDYGSVKVALDEGGHAASPALWAGLRVMEAAAKSRLNGVRDAE